MARVGVAKPTLVLIIILILLFLIALGLGLAAASIPRWVSYRGEHTTYVDERGYGIDEKNRTFGYAAKLGLFRRCIRSLEYPDEPCWPHEQAEPMYEDHMLEPCVVCKYLFVVGIGVGFFFGLLLACLSLCVVNVVVRIIIFFAALAATCLQLATIIMWPLYWEERDVWDRTYGVSFWLAVGATIAHFLAMLLALWLVIDALRSRKKKASVEIVPGKVYTATMKDTRVINGKEEETVTRLLVHTTDT